MLRLLDYESYSFTIKFLLADKTAMVKKMPGIDKAFVPAKVTEIKHSDCFAVIALSFKMSSAVGVERIDIPTAVGTMQFSFRQFGTFGKREIQLRFHLRQQWLLLMCLHFRILHYILPPKFISVSMYSEISRRSVYFNT